MKKLLIIDGRANIREYLADNLAAEGYLVVPIAKPSLAKEIVPTLGPDLILLHLDTDTYTVSAEFKEQFPCLPILALTTLAGSENNPCSSCDDVFVFQGLDFDGLQHKVAEVLRRQKSKFKTGSKNNNLQI